MQLLPFGISGSFGSPAMRRTALAASLAVWLGLAGVTHVVLTKYAFTPGPKSQGVSTWPSAAGLRHEPGKHSLVVFIHPRCPCSRATMTELEQIVEHHGPAVALSVVFITHPDRGLTIDPRSDPLWLRASALRGATVLVDPDAKLASLFGALTSGHSFLFGPDDRLEFEGGLTSARGHEGRSAGTDAACALLRGEIPMLRSAPVFGCELVDGEPPESAPR